MLSLNKDVLSVVCRTLSKRDLLSLCLCCRALSSCIGPLILDRKACCEAKSKRRLSDSFVPPPTVKAERRRRFTGPEDPAAYYELLEGIHFCYTDIREGTVKVTRFRRGGGVRYGATVNTKWYGTFEETGHSSWLLHIEQSHHVVSMWDGSSWGCVYARQDIFQIEIVDLHCVFSVRPDKYAYMLCDREDLNEKDLDIRAEWEEVKKVRDTQDTRFVSWAELKRNVTDKK
jgi:hypothetical protein